MVTRLVHANVVCSDLEKSLHFYVDVLGGRIHQRMDSSGSDLRPSMGVPDSGAPHYKAALIYFGDGTRGGPYIDLVQWHYDDRSQRTPSRAPLGAQDYGLARVALEVASLEEAAQTLSRHGIDPVGPPQDEIVGPWRLKLLFCNDPDGTLVELVEFPLGTHRDQLK